MLSRPWALRFKSAHIRPFKSGTSCSQTPGGSKNTSHQTWKKVTTSLLTRIYLLLFQLWRLVFLQTTWSSGTQCTSFQRSHLCSFKSKSSRPWQHFYLLPHPFQKGHFTPIKGQEGSHIHFPRLHVKIGNILFFWGSLSKLPSAIPKALIWHFPFYFPVEAILGNRTRHQNGSTEYLVKWKGWTHGCPKTHPRG